ncbi:hypothetical protein [Pseudomonas savastanoi]|uniref:Uncharacterized protein n=2 Tax=Pseudomonas savastanoi pv. glycinea TaxID=318 RepID=A0A0P9RXQ4_PSESG|nr:hypothetical protein [Pseudomonas savastanoi]EFW80843.1 hypothetical protein PsgB076_10355 [Pseudomonas savastanoi pv. glycinea str. B076]EFW84744.1 hypothetical protein PsgRace4_15654 [Pseudomonas savastanoi pv. glycinea str. race 4]EGH16162.1 hypothetical protein Pgy4_24073 [Pseudomonas savastanoi pv. glycinea str. race 4]KPX48836.1 hypothetical protein ALO37_102797 [Pseudomonas savastanoi pv. glycinea]MCQ3008634.1 hypothetical protein [Pseudomonas savastanoi]
MQTKEYYQTIRGLHTALGDLAYSLAVFGDTLTKREKYKSPDLTGIEAVHYYLIQKYSWTPSQVRGMSFEDIRFVLTEEMNGYVMPREALE